MGTVGLEGRPPSKRKSQRPLNVFQLAFQLFHSDVKDGLSMSAVQLPPDPTKLPPVVTLPPEQLKKAVLKRSAEVKDVIEEARDNYGPKH